MITADIDPAQVLANIINPLGNRFAQLFIWKIMNVDGLRITFGAPGLTGVFIGTDQFLLFCIYRDHGALIFEIQIFGTQLLTHVSPMGAVNTT